MKFTSFILVFFCQVANLAIAETISAPTTISTTPLPSENPTSEQLRGQRQFFVGPRYGLMSSAVPAYGLEAGYHLNSSWQFGLSFATGSMDVKGLANSYANIPDTIRLNTATISNQMIVANARYFVLNSFYLGLGLGQRTFKYEVDLEMKDGSGGINVKGVVNSIVLTPHVGNIWTLDNGIYLGAEWFGLALPLASTKSTDINYRGPFIPTVLQDDENDIQSATDKVGRSISFSAVMAHAGYSF